MEAKTNIELNVLYCTDNEITEDQVVLKIMNALQDGESQIVVSPANQHGGDAKATWIEPTKPQMDLIPEHHQRDLKLLAEITGHSFESLVAGYWYRYGEVQTLQIELEWRDKMIETLKLPTMTPIQKAKEIAFKIFVAGRDSLIPGAIQPRLRFEEWMKEPEAQALLSGEDWKENDEKIRDAVELIRKQSGVYIWAYPITYRDAQGKVEKITYGWELEWPNGKTDWYRHECETYFEALNAGIKAYQ